MMTKEMMEKVIAYIQATICDTDFQKAHKVKARYFSRSDCGVITFEQVMLFVLFHMKNTLGLAVIQFCKSLNINVFGASAITKARQKISFTAFYSLFVDTAKMIEPRKLYKSFRLIAFDGTALQLPNTPELHGKYSNESTTSHVPMAHVVASYDVLNKIFLDATFCPYPANERLEAAKLIDRMGTSLSGALLLFDRGFPSVSLLKKLNELGGNYVFRVSSSFLKEVNLFRLSAEFDKTVNINFTKRRIHDSKLQDELEPFSFPLRLVKIILPSGEQEILLTNTADTFTIEELYEIYGLRWGIETGFNFIKNAIEIEKFNSILENSILQELYASLLSYNLSRLLVDEAQTDVDKKKLDLTYRYAVNVSKAIALFNSYLPMLLLCKCATKLSRLIMTLCSLIAKFSEPVRKNLNSRTRTKSNAKFPIGYGRNAPIYV